MMQRLSTAVGGVRGRLQPSASGDLNRSELEQSEQPNEEDDSGSFDGDEIKDKVLQALTKPEYNVQDFYDTSGAWQYIACHPVFENATLCVIAFNAVWMGVDTDYNPSPTLLGAQPLFQIVEHFFCTFFSFEWLVRFMSFRLKRDCLRDAWFVFDSILVALMVMETWAMSLVVLMSPGDGGGNPVGNAAVLRLFRLLRLSRMVRMLRSLPELMILVKGIMSAVRSVFTVMCLLLIIMYVFAIAMTQLSQGTDMGEAFFSSVSESMYALLVYGVFIDSTTDMWDTIGDESVVCLIIWFIFMLLSALTVLNMLIGVLCEVVSAVASREREDMQICFVNERLQAIVNEIDHDGDLHISKSEFRKILSQPAAVKALEEVGVDPVGIVDFTDFIFANANGDEDSHLSFRDFMDIVLELRNSRSATVKDLVDLRKFVRSAIETCEENLISPQGVGGKKSFNLRGRPRSRRCRTLPTNGSARLADSDGVQTSKSCAATPCVPYSPNQSPASGLQNNNLLTDELRCELDELAARTQNLEDLMASVLGEVKGISSALRQEQLRQQQRRAQGQHKSLRETAKVVRPARHFVMDELPPASAELIALIAAAPGAHKLHKQVTRLPPAAGHIPKSAPTAWPRPSGAPPIPTRLCGIDPRARKPNVGTPVGLFAAGVEGTSAVMTPQMMVALPLRSPVGSGAYPAKPLETPLFDRPIFGAYFPPPVPPQIPPFPVAWHQVPPLAGLPGAISSPEAEVASNASDSGAATLPMICAHHDLEDGTLALPTRSRSSAGGGSPRTPWDASSSSEGEWARVTPCESVEPFTACDDDKADCGFTATAAAEAVAAAAAKAAASWALLAAGCTPRRSPLR